MLMTIQVCLHLRTSLNENTLRTACLFNILFVFFLTWKLKLRESSFNMTRGGDEDIEGGLRKFLDTQRKGSEKIVALGGGASKICILQNQHMTSSYRSDGFQLDNLMTCATQLYHVVYRYNKCSLNNYYTLVHPKNALENCITTVSQVCHSINH